MLASWGRRALAQIVDAVIVGVGALILVLLLIALGFSADSDSGLVAYIVFALVSVLAFTVVAFLYAPLMMARTNGQTVGRQLTGIRVIRADGQPMTFGYAMLREVAVKALLVGVASSFTFGIAWLLDVLWPLWDEENRALHDFVVNTRTIRTRRRAPRRAPRGCCGPSPSRSRGPARDRRRSAPPGRRRSPICTRGSRARPAAARSRRGRR